jgi:hypothetical protein
MYMNEFIHEQIDSYHGKKYKKSDLKIKDDKIFMVEIKNNKLIYNKNFKVYPATPGRIPKIINILTLLVSKYSITDTLLLIYTADGYFWKKDIPVFNYAGPLGKQGLIFLNFDVLKFLLSDKIIDYDDVKLLCKKYEPADIKNDMYFKGSSASLGGNKIREHLSKEPLPIHVDLNTQGPREEIYKIKNHKYILDLPGVKPQSLRLKYLYLMDRVIIRVSFYDSSMNETSYWRQYYDFIMNDDDYIHLKYDVHYDKPLTKIEYIKIKKDILKKYYEFEQNPKLYKDTVKNMNKKRRYLTVNNAFKYLYHVIEEYTHNLLID